MGQDLGIERKGEVGLLTEFPRLFGYMDARGWSRAPTRTIRTVSCSHPTIKFSPVAVPIAQQQTISLQEDALCHWAVFIYLSGIRLHLL